MAPGLVFFTLIVLTTTSSAVYGESNTGEFSLMCLLPKVLYEGDPNKFILDARNFDASQAKANLKIVDQDNDTIVHFERDYLLDKEAGPIYELDVSGLSINRAGSKKYASTYRAILEGDFGSKKIRENTTLRVQKDDVLLLVQTDKEKYKPGQKVYIRIMPLDYNLRPRNGGNLSVSVSDPLSNVVAHWKDVLLTDMVIQFDLQLTEEPSMGTWYIHVKYDMDQGFASTLDDDMDSSLPLSALQTATFSVLEYTLPKFEVTITPPSFVLMDAKNISWRICANYTFGKPVLGILKINTTLAHYHWEQQRIPDIYFEGKIDGCYNYTIDSSSLDLNNPAFQYRHIKLVANVFEDKTKEQMNATHTLSRTSEPLKMVFLPEINEKYFRPYMNTYGQVKVSRPDDTPAAGELIELCLTAKSERFTLHHQRTDVRLMCKNYTSDDQGVIDFVIAPHNPSVVSFNIEATAVNFPSKSFPESEFNLQITQPRSSSSYRAFFSPSERYLQFEPVLEKKLPCDAPVRLSAYYTFEEGDRDIKFEYVVMARSRNIFSSYITVVDPQAVLLRTNDTSILTEDYPNVWSDAVKDNKKKIGRIDFEVDPGSTQLPQLTIVLYYVQNATELVADSIKVKREVCQSNKVELNFSESVIQPGAPVVMTLAGSAQSQCGYDIVDRSVKLLSGKQINPFIKYRNELPNKEIGRWEYPQPDIYGYCRNKGGQSDYVDSEMIILPAGWTTIMHNIKLQTRPCRSTRNGAAADGFAPERGNTRLPLLAASSLPLLRAPLAPAQLNIHRFHLRPIEARPQSGPAPSASRIGGDFGVATATASQSIVEVRDYFPELWLFELQATDGTGRLVKNLTAPHQVTTWSADAVCIHAKDGLGVADTKEVKTYQAFFTEAKLPYSVKRGENLPIIISTFNYLPHCMPVSISVDAMAGIQVDEKTPLTKEVCICPDSSPHHYELRATVTEGAEIGDLNVTVTATNSDKSDLCANVSSKTVPSRDKVTRQLKVVPEGFMVERSESRLLCPKGGAVNADFKLDAPEEAVNGSKRSLFSVSGDIMGQALSNLENLIVLPTGCGEQNMAKIMSNLAVYKYLAASKQLDANQEARIIRNLKSGYQNQLKFRARDGSYSVWGNTWAKPSSFLTAMAYRGLRAAKDLIFVDDVGQNATLNYLLNTQNKTTGCFQRHGSIFSWGLRRSEESTDTRGSYTAYVLINLKDAITDKRRVKKALLCIEAQKNMNAHSLALSAYAAALYDNKELAKRYLANLSAFENIKLPNQKYYATHDVGSSTAIETNAYAILATMALDKDSTQETLENVQPMVRWLMKKQNRNGGFSSSHDTALGLQAMSEFALSTHGDQAGIDNDVIVSGTDFEHTFKINKENAAVWDTRIIRTIPNEIIVTSKGSGCVVANSQLRYNLPNVPGEKGFFFNISIAEGSTVENVGLELCVLYESENGQPSSMAIVELNLLSGYVANKKSLAALTASGKARLYDIEDGRVIIYFNEFNETLSCADVQLNQVFNVENLQPATAKVYDYYDSEKQKSVKYDRGDLPSDFDNF